MQCRTCSSQLSPQDQFCPNCGMVTPYNSSQAVQNNPTVVPSGYQYQPLPTLYGAPPPPPVYSGELSQVAAKRRKWRWGNIFVAVLIIAILSIGTSMVIFVSGLHLFRSNQSPSSNPPRIPTAPMSSSPITNSPSVSPTITITPNSSRGNIFDAAGILDQNQVKNAETSLRYPVDIYTTQNFSGTSIQFEQRARSRLTNANTIVMAISTSPRYMTIVAGSGVPLSNSEANSVISSFRNGYQSSNGNFTSATASALQQLQSLLT